MTTCLGSLAAVLLAGCASQQALLERRIAEKADAFQALSEADRARVRTGEVRIGDSQDVVWIARGRPARIFRRVTASGTNTVWSYTQHRVDADSDLVPVTVWTREPRGEMRPSTEFVWVDRNTSHEYEVYRVEFRTGRVAAIENLEPTPD